MKILNILLTLIVSLGIGVSQVPQAFNYQAVVRDADGAVMANKDISLKVDIISNSDTTYPVYSEKHDTRTDKLGYVHLEIGKGIVISGSFDEIDWSGSRNMQISFKEIGEGEYQVLGVVQLLSVPYALYAENAGNSNSADVDSTNELQALSISNDTIYLTEGGYVKLPSVTTGDDDTSSTNELQVLTISNDTLYLSKSNYVVLTDSNQWEPNNNDIFYDKGNIGIGTTQPKTKLHVNEDILVDNPDNGIVLVSPGDMHWRLTINNDGSLNVDTMEYTLILQPGPEDGKDAGLWSCKPDENRGNFYGFIAMAYSWASLSCDLGYHRSLIDFELSNLPATASIKKANLYLYNPNDGYAEHQALSGSNACVLKRITAPWDENTITWNNQPTTTDVNQVTLPQSTTATENYVIDITNLIVDYLNNPGSSYGFMLKLITEEKYRILWFASSDYTDANLRPKLEIVYTIEP